MSSADTSPDTLERQCDVPLRNVQMPEGYTHYPITDEDIVELIDDLQDGAGLSLSQAVEVAGFAATAAWLNCDNYWTITGMIDRGWLENWGAQNLPGQANKAAFKRGIELADKEKRNE